MIGDGPERIIAEQLCRELGIEHKVKFLGKLRVIEKMLAITDVFVLPSESESFGLVALEAMASKTAVISTNSGGISEVNIDGKTGFLSNVGDLNKMAGDTIKLLENQNLLEKFKQNALQHAKSFSLKNVLPRYNEIYHRLCQR
jgi:glycosyltransferase involved in cell wall biosynthesis